MSDEEEALLVCVRQTGPSAVPARPDVCSMCGHSVWRAFTSRQDLKAMCMECFAIRLREHPEETVTIMGLSEAQRAELREFLGTNDL